MKEACESNFGNTLHHAYCIEGGRDSVPFIEGYIRSLSGEHAHVLVQSFGLFGVDEARTLSKSSSLSATSDSPHIELVYADMFSVEAQNALLKAIEEPAHHTHYIFVTPRLDKLLPTLLSRSISFSLLNENIDSESVLEMREFLGAGRVTRMSIVARYIKDHEDEEGETSRRALDDFFERMITYISTIESKDKSQALSVLMNARSFIQHKGSSQKMIAEYVGLMIPEYFK